MNGYNPEAGGKERCGISRGLGKTQRAILEILQDGEWHKVHDLADIIYAECCRGYIYDPGQNATQRATKTLERNGLIELRRRYNYTRSITSGGPSTQCYIEARRISVVDT